MSFKEFTANISSTRDYENTRIEENVIADIIAFLREINAEVGIDKGFSFVVLENGEEVFSDLQGVGGYSGVMIKSPHYIALTILEEDPEVEFYSAYYMQSIVKKLYDMKLGTCWINIKSIPREKKSKLVKTDAVNVNYLLAFGVPDEKAIKQKTPHMTVTSSAAYKQDPYGTKVNEADSPDKVRHSLGEIVYLHEWGKQATYEELENRGMADVFFYVRNAPSYKNLQPCRLILKDGEAELAILNPESEGSYTDAGIMMYILQGLAKDMGIPGQWHFVRDMYNKEYSIVAKMKL